MQKLCGCPELGLFKEQRKPSVAGTKESCGQWERVSAKREAGGQASKTLLATEKSLEFVHNATGSL